MLTTWASLVGRKGRSGAAGLSSFQSSTFTSSWARPESFPLMRFFFASRPRTRTTLSIDTSARRARDDPGSAETTTCTGEDCASTRVKKWRFEPVLLYKKGVSTLESVEEPEEAARSPRFGQPACDHHLLSDLSINELRNRMGDPGQRSWSKSISPRARSELVEGSPSEGASVPAGGSGNGRIVVRTSLEWCLLEECGQRDIERAASGRARGAAEAELLRVPLDSSRVGGQDVERARDLLSMCEGRRGGEEGEWMVVRSKGRPAQPNPLVAGALQT